MTLQKFSIEAVQKARQHICAQLVLPSSEQHPPPQLVAPETIEDTPEPASLDALGNLFRAGGFIDTNTPAPNEEGRWFISTIDPAAAVKKLPGLSLKSGVRLVTYLQRKPEGGLGVTWALPDLMSTTVQLEMALTTAENSSVPRPQGALSHVMESIEGDATPVSFIVASLLAREWRELGRIGVNHRWSQHRLIATVPFEQRKQAWQWQTKRPKDLSPKVKVRADHSAVVEFFSCRIVSPVAIFRHLDQYPPNSYRPKIQDRAIAVLQKSSAK